MSERVRVSELVSATGISKSYASELLNGHRAPSRGLAFKIFDATGLKLGPIAKLTDEDVATLARIELAA